MAFVSSIPVLAPGQKSAPISPRRTSPSATSTGPKPPARFKNPDPRVAFIRPDKAVDIATIGLGQLIRFGSGALIEGYRLKRENNKLVEYSSTLPQSRPDKPLHVFEFEACPYCRKVREAISLLDLDVIFFPCPRSSTTYRTYVVNSGGKAQFPYIEDPNTGFSGYESDDIISYLYKTYGPVGGRIPPTLRTTVLAGLASAVRKGAGMVRTKKTVPAKYPLELWGYEASPFVKLVRETLTELEIAHLYHSTSRGSPTRAILKDLTGRFQVPYLVDPNTGIQMWESAEICEYLVATYGEDAVGAVANPPAGSMYMPGDPIVQKDIREQSLDPQPQTDERLEEYCKDNPEADECRVYED